MNTTTVQYAKECDSSIPSSINSSVLFSSDP